MNRIRIEMPHKRIGNTHILAETTSIAQEEVTRLLERCIAEFGTEPPVWTKRLADSAATRVDDARNIDLDEVTDVMFQPGFLQGG